MKMEKTAEVGDLGEGEEGLETDPEDLVSQ